MARQKPVERKVRLSLEMDQALRREARAAGLSDEQFIRQSLMEKLAAKKSAMQQCCDSEAAARDLRMLWKYPWAQ
jgi:hypothetical protein